MGSYLSEPITKKVSIDEENDKLAYGASSMQGWRESQEVKEFVFNELFVLYCILNIVLFYTFI